MRRAIRTRATCIGVMIAIMLIWVFSHQHRLASVEAMMTDVSGQEQQVTIHLAKKEQMDAERRRLSDCRQLIEKLSEGVDLVVVFGEISRRMPETVVLTELHAQCLTLDRYVILDEPELIRPEVESRPRSAPETGRPPVPGPHGSEPAAANPPAAALPREDLKVDRVTLIGVAREIPEVIAFAAALESSPLFTRVQMEMKDPATWSGRRVQRFEIRGDLARQVGGQP